VIVAVQAFDLGGFFMVGVGVVVVVIMRLVLGAAVSMVVAAIGAVDMVGGAVIVALRASLCVLRGCCRLGLGDDLADAVAEAADLLSMAARSLLPSWRSVMVPEVTETETSSTPGMRRTAVSILVAQPAQSMPSTLYRFSTVSVIIRFLWSACLPLTSLFPTSSSD
jgi:hypothetical protein